MRLFIHCMKFRSVTISSLLRGIQWSILDMVTLLVGLERSSLLSRVQERKRTHRRPSVKCTTQILICGLRCQIWTLAVIIIHHAPSETLQSMFSVESRTQLESTSTQSNDMISPTSWNGLKLISTTRCSQRGKDVEQFKRMDSSSSFSEVSLENSLETATTLIAWAISYHVPPTPQMIYFCSRCQQSMMHKLPRSTAVISKGTRYTDLTTVTTGVYPRLCALRSETDQFTLKLIKINQIRSHTNPF